MFDTYFVLNGLFNGEDGTYAKTTGVGEQQADGWYWIIDGIDDGVGPYRSEEAARMAAMYAIEDYEEASRLNASDPT